jgi:hypothetical protein
MIPPGFNAEASLYKSTVRYVLLERDDVGQEMIVGTQLLKPMSECGPCINGIRRCIVFNRVGLLRAFSLPCDFSSLPLT